MAKVAKMCQRVGIRNRRWVDIMGKIRLTRKLVDKLPANVPDPGVISIEGAASAGDYHERTTENVIKELGPDQDLWVFAIGSLIWNPRLNTIETRRARIVGWQRQFCIGPDTRYRGNPDAPGVMLSLDRGGECQGVVFRVARSSAAAELLELLKTEPPIPPVWVDSETDQGMVKAIAFACDPGGLGYVGGLSVQEIAKMNAAAVGMLGSMPDYILNTVENLEKFGIHDAHMWEMQDRVAAELEKMPD